MSNNTETKNRNVVTTHDDRGGFVAHPDNPRHLTWNAEERRFMTHEAAGAFVMRRGVDFEFPEAWGWDEVMADFEAKWAVKDAEKKAAFWTAEAKRVRELA